MRAVCLSELSMLSPGVGYPSDKTSLKTRLLKEGAKAIEGTVAGGQKGLLFKVDTLPPALRTVALAAKAEGEDESLSLHRRYGAAPKSVKEDAARRYAMVRRYHAELKAGASKSAGRRAAATAFGVTPATVKNALKAIEDLPENDWLPALVKDYKGRPKGDIHPEILRYFFGEYGRVEQPQAQAVYERTLAAAKNKGWGDVPSLKTLLRRWKALPANVRILWRDGEEALADAYPHAERDRAGMLSNQSWNIDSRRWDNLVRDGNRVYRPTVAILQDESSNFIVGYAVAETESSALYIRVICGAFERYGIADQIRFDNTRAAANKALTAGTKKRFRFKPQEDDAEGILKLVGCEPSFAPPGRGRSKPVERCFADIKERTERHPRLAGSYTGRSPIEKPANYGAKPTELSTLCEVLDEGIEEYNNRENRRGKLAFQTSHKAVFERGLSARPVRKLCAWQRRLFFSLAEVRTVSDSGTVLLGKRPHTNRYYSPALLNHRGEKIVFRYSPDDLTVPLIAMTLDNRLIDEAVPLIEKRGWNDVDQARDYERARRSHLKEAKKAAASVGRMSELEIQASLGKPAPPSPPPDTPVIAPVFTRTPKAAPSRDLEKDVADTLAGLEKVRRYGFGG